MIAKGATMYRHNNQRPSGEAILTRYLELNRVDLNIQQELAEGKTLLETAAGAEINKDLIDLEKKHRAAMQEARADMEKALEDKDREMQKLIRDEHAKLRAQHDKAMEDMQRLADTRYEEVTALREKVTDLESSRKSEAFWDLIGRALNSLL